MKRDPIRDMERQAARLLLKQPGIIFAGWFWQEWALVLCAVIVVVLIGFGISLLP